MKKNAPLALVLLSMSFGYAFNGFLHSISSGIPWKIIASAIAVGLFSFLIVKVLRSMRRK